MNKITVYFQPCTPTPSNGYKVIWRVAGSSDAYTNAGYFYASPAVFYDTVNLPGTLYEGFIQSVQGDNECNQIPWATEASGGMGESYAIALIGVCAGINSSYSITGGTAGDIVTVRASFGGTMQMNSGLFLRADLTIASPDGTTASVSSACYSDASSHGFTITADTVITMAGPTATVNLMAVVNNSLETYTNVGMRIIDVNGVEKEITCTGCRGNSATGGTC